MPRVLDENVEWVDPGGNTSGEISPSRAQMPLSGLRPFVSALPKTMMSGSTPNSRSPRTCRAEEAHLDLVVDEQDMSLVENLLQRREIFRRRDDVAAGALDRLDVEGRRTRTRRPWRPRTSCTRSRSSSRTALRSRDRSLPAFCRRAAEAVRERHECARSEKWPKRRR